MMYDYLTAETYCGICRNITVFDNIQIKVGDCHGNHRKIGDIQPGVAGDAVVAEGTTSCPRCDAEIVIDVYLMHSKFVGVSPASGLFPPVEKGYCYIFGISDVA